MPEVSIFEEHFGDQYNNMINKLDKFKKTRFSVWFNYIKGKPLSEHPKTLQYAWLITEFMQTKPTPYEFMTWHRNTVTPQYYPAVGQYINAFYTYKNNTTTAQEEEFKVLFETQATMALNAINAFSGTQIKDLNDMHKKIKSLSPNFVNQLRLRTWRVTNKLVWHLVELMVSYDNQTKPYISFIDYLKKVKTKLIINRFRVLESIYKIIKSVEKDNVLGYTILHNVYRSYTDDLEKLTKKLDFKVSDKLLEFNVTEDKSLTEDVVERKKEKDEDEDEDDTSSDLDENSNPKIQNGKKRPIPSNDKIEVEDVEPPLKKFILDQKNYLISGSIVTVYTVLVLTTLASIF